MGQNQEPPRGRRTATEEEEEARGREGGKEGRRRREGGNEGGGGRSDGSVPPPLPPLLPAAGEQQQEEGKGEEVGEGKEDRKEEGREEGGEGRQVSAPTMETAPYTPQKMKGGQREGGRAGGRERDRLAAYLLPLSPRLLPLFSLINARQRRDFGVIQELAANHDRQRFRTDRAGFDRIRAHARQVARSPQIQVPFLVQTNGLLSVNFRARSRGAGRCQLVAGRDHQSVPR